METFLSDTTQAVLLGVIAVVFGLSWLARAHPRLAWLQLFKLPVVQLSEEERARKRRTATRIAAGEIMVAGLALPLLYGLSTVMMFNEPGTLASIAVGACSVGCIALGAWMLVRCR